MARPRRNQAVLEWAETREAVREVHRKGEAMGHEGLIRCTMAGKQCYRCKSVKPINEFGKRISSKDGRKGVCYVCERKDTSDRRKKNLGRYKGYQDKYKAKNADRIETLHHEYVEKNKEKIRKKLKIWHEQNREKSNEYKRLWAKNNREKVLNAKRKYHSENKEKAMADRAKRRVSKIQANMLWGNKFFIEEIYSLARLRTKIFGFIWEVDHVIPLQGKNVCGLHVEHNLNVIPKIINRKKGNCYVP